jgi:hypothetical protein
VVKKYSTCIGINAAKERNPGNYFITYGHWLLKVQDALKEHFAMMAENQEQNQAKRARDT